MENKRIFSTVVLIIFLAIVCLLCWTDIDFLVMLKSFTPDSSVEYEGEEGLIAFMFLGMIFGFEVIFILAIAGLIILISLICLGYSIRNTKVENKPVKVINIVLSCLFAAAVALAIIVLILMRVL